MPISTISADTIPSLLEAKKRLIDVRTPGEYKSAHVVGAELMPLDALDASAFCEKHGKDTPVYILCQSGKRASMAAEKLAAAGHTATYVVDGGTQAAVKAGVAVERGKGSISIERQVRIAAGLLVFIGTALGYFVHPAMFIIPAFVGAGLTFAGITDTCGMALLLGKCPWNQ